MSNYIFLIYNFSLLLLKEDNIDYQDIFESNSTLRTPMSIHMKNKKEFEEKVYRDTTDKGTITITNLPVGEIDIDIDGFKYATKKLGKKSVSLELPYGTYKISCGADGLDSGIGDDRTYISGWSTDKIEVSISSDIQQVTLKFKRGLIGAKLKII